MRRLRCAPDEMTDHICIIGLSRPILRPHIRREAAGAEPPCFISLSLVPTERPDTVRALFVPMHAPVEDSMRGAPDRTHRWPNCAHECARRTCAPRSELKTRPRLPGDAGRDCWAIVPAISQPARRSAVSRWSILPPSDRRHVVDAALDASTAAGVWCRSASDRRTRRHHGDREPAAPDRTSALRRTHEPSSRFTFTPGNAGYTRAP